MTKKYSYGEKYAETEATVIQLENQNEELSYLKKNGNVFTYSMDESAIVYGLGENVRGMNKRGHIYESFCSDQFEHAEETRSLYGAHNFLIIDGNDLFGIFIDTPGKVTFDVGFTNLEELKITVENDGYDIYIITEKSPDLIVTEFRKLTGRSYMPPKWAFGNGQSRWGYATEQDIKKVKNEYKKNGIPLDMIYMDIDYMERFKDFTVDSKKFPDLTSLAQECKKDSVRLIPIIDAGVKVEKDYDVYEEGIKNGYFCKDEDGKEFIVGVWPGNCVLPDVLNPKVRKWFGLKYKTLVDQGIDGFWNDMNEPALFYSEKNLKKTMEKFDEFKKSEIDIYKNFEMKDLIFGIANNMEDYKSFYHNVNGKNVQHYKVHNLYGYNLTRAASEGLREISKERKLLFSRASYIGMHRYSGIWMGDNKSRWLHLIMNLRMLPSLNMCGFLYAGADMCGFGADTTEDLALRWYALGIFMPLMRNHAALGTREQEPYQFKNIKAFRDIISLRYRLLPYLYSEFMKAALNDTMYARPLGFIWNKDDDARRCEDQIMIGESIMIAPVYEQNASGRHVYLPEDMKMIKFKNGEVFEEKIMTKGHGYYYAGLDEVVIFVRKNHILPLAESAMSVDKISWDNLTLISYEGNEYQLYNDDGLCLEPSLNGNIKTLKI